MARTLRLMLAASGGGHVRQLLDLESIWADLAPTIVTEDTALGRSLAARHRVRFVPHFAIGQARLGAPLAMAWGALRNLLASLMIVIVTRPDVVISTGAGAAFWTVFFARALGAEFILIESFARFDAPSKFGRIASRLATQRIVQSAALTRFWPDAAVFDPFCWLEGPRPAKEPLLFATVGATLAFPRLTKAVLEAKRDGLIPYRVILQAGDEAAALPATDGVEIVETLDFDRVQAILRTAEIVICHGGTGSLITALREGCRVIAMSRSFARGEHYDDHQDEIVSAFAARGLVLTAGDAADIGTCIGQAASGPAPMATIDPVALRQHLRGVLESIADKRCVALP